MPPPASSADNSGVPSPVCSSVASPESDPTLDHTLEHSAATPRVDRNEENGATSNLDDADTEYTEAAGWLRQHQHDEREPYQT